MQESIFKYIDVSDLDKAINALQVIIDHPAAFEEIEATPEELQTLLGKLKEVHNDNRAFKLVEVKDEGQVASANAGESDGSGAQDKSEGTKGDSAE